jgi:hypothetical protein
VTSPAKAVPLRLTRCIVFLRTLLMTTVPSCVTAMPSMPTSSGSATRTVSAVPPGASVKILPPEVSVANTMPRGPTAMSLQIAAPSPGNVGRLSAPVRKVERLERRTHARLRRSTERRVVAHP